MLSDEVKSFIVQRLACHATPSEASEAVKEEFGLDVPRQQCALYDPGNVVAKDLSQKWRDLFAATRKAFQENFARVGIQHRAVRLEALDDMMRKAKRAKNFLLAAQLIEQAAKEVGDVYTNRREMTGKDGGPIQHENVPRSPGADRLAHWKQRYAKRGGANENARAREMSEIPQKPKSVPSAR
jgi:hypothetical protein